MSDNKNPAPYSCATSGCLHDILATRLAASEAKRDAAVARADKWEAKWDLLKRDYNDAGLKYGECRADILAEGERRATAAIVADLRLQGRTYWDGDPDADELTDRYERGDHLKGNPQ